MLHLYEIVEQYQQLKVVIERTDATDEDFELTLKAIEDSFDRKVENIAKLCLSLESNIAALKQEEARLHDRRSSMEHTLDWLKDYTLDQMTAIGVESVKRDTVSVSVRVNPPSVHIYRLEDVPLEFCSHVPDVWQPDRKRILDHFKATGEILPGVDIVSDKKRIEIK
ncbi:MAG: siphovirus Gp157 family protein [Dehalococcoidia bacterium]|nr:siphovirus Gp157 family protein [Dehalococcoidia bacterium]